MTKQEKVTTITLTLQQACGLAIPAMLRTQQAKITVHDEGEDVGVCAEFAADQDVMVQLHQDVVTAVSVTFKIGRQPTLAALAALDTAGFTPLVFDLTALGEGALKTCPVNCGAGVPLDVLHESAPLVAGVLTRLLSTDVKHDGTTDHHSLVKPIIDQSGGRTHLAECGDGGTVHPAAAAELAAAVAAECERSVRAEG